MSVKDLIDNLNSFDFQAYGPKDESGKPSRASLSIDIEGSRHFLTRIATSIDDNGEPTGYKWCKGKQFRSQS